MKRLSIIHLGIGNVGKEVVSQIVLQKEAVQKEFGVSLEYFAKFTSKNSSNEIRTSIQAVSLPFVVVDTTTSDVTIPYIELALKRGGFVVLANKKPLSGKQDNFDSLKKLGGQRLLHECVVGAGLPVIRPLKELLMTGDEIVEIQGCFSGTLGFLFSQLDNGSSFSRAVLAAKNKGFTEPDPREDLSGIDVARKALILARLIGQKIELEDIKLEPLYPKEMQKLSVEDFLKNVNKLDADYLEKVKKAKLEHKVLRFVARVSQKECSVGLQYIEALSNIGGLKGPENLISIKTKRYLQNPLVIKGPGAGIAVTAAGVFGDILRAAETIERECANLDQMESGLASHVLS